MVEFVDTADTIDAEWEDLADRVGASPFLRPGWFRAWSRAFGRDLIVLTARRDGELVGVLPLVRAHGRLVSATGHDAPEFGFVAVDIGAIDVLAEALFGSAPRSTLIRFLDPARPDEGRLRNAAERAGYRTLRRGGLQSPYVAITGTWEDYERALGGKVRSTIRRRWRRLREEGDVVLDIRCGDGLPELLTEGYRIEASGWKGASGTAIRSNHSTQMFYSEVAQWAAARGWLRLCFLRLSGRGIAFHFDLVANGILYSLKTGFDTEFARFAPGKALNYLMIEHAFRTGLWRFDFLGEDEPHKIELANGFHDRRAFHAFAPRVTARAERLGYVFAIPIGRRILDFRKRSRNSRN